MQNSPVEPLLVQWRWRLSVTVLPRDKEKPLPSKPIARPVGQTSLTSSLPWPEIPLLSTSEQHRVQRDELTKPSDVECSNPGTIELKGQASHSFSKSL